MPLVLNGVAAFLSCPTPIWIWHFCFINRALLQQELPPLYVCQWNLFQVKVLTTLHCAQEASAVIIIRVSACSFIEVTWKSKITLWLSRAKFHGHEVYWHSMRSKNWHYFFTKSLEIWMSIGCHNFLKMWPWYQHNKLRCLS